MRESRLKYGLATIGTLTGAAYGYSHWPWDPEGGRYLYNLCRTLVEQAQHMVGYAAVGALVGIGADLLLNGLPRPREWQFDLRMLLAFVAACGLFFYGISCFWRVLDLQPYEAQR